MFLEGQPMSIFKTATRLTWILDACAGVGPGELPHGARLLAVADHVGVRHPALLLDRQQVVSPGLILGEHVLDKQSTVR